MMPRQPAPWRHAAGTLLQNVGDFVPQESLACGGRGRRVSRGDVDVVAAGKSQRAELAGERRILMDANAGKIGVERPFHAGSNRRRYFDTLAGSNWHGVAENANSAEIVADVW